MNLQSVFSRWDVGDLKCSVLSRESKKRMVVDENPSPHGTMVNASKPMRAKGVRGGFERVLVEFSLGQIDVESIFRMIEHDIVDAFVAVGKCDEISLLNRDGFRAELKILLVDSERLGFGISFVR